MEVTLSQLIEAAPELAVALRTDIRRGKLPAKRQEGVAGRPYLVDTHSLLQSDREGFRQLAQDLEAGREIIRTKSDKGSAGVSHSRRIGEEIWPPFMKIMESQQSMMNQLLDVFTEEMRRRQDRVDRQAREMQELSYKLGQSHQQIERLERILKERTETRLEQA
ncbi:MAG: hypothetical protein C7B44_03385 [Sulfobacillus thermosulfidooxidans]|nr:MAG: hypothetical protein C7B44_03385 [Sulfobacillus thermosulfidooxidans]